MECIIRVSAVSALILLGSFQAAGVAKGQDCPNAPGVQVEGLIGNMWRKLGGAKGPYGCPITGEFPGPRGGRIRRFVGGEIAWTPAAGKNALVGAYRNGDSVDIDWQDTDPFNYDLFIVRWDKNGVHDERDGQTNVTEFITRTSGHFSIQRAPRNVEYTFLVEGCDHTDFGSRCRQGWMNPVSAAPFNVTQPAPAARPETISVSIKNGSFLVSGSGFKPNGAVTIRVVDDALTNKFYHATANSTGTFQATLALTCYPGQLHFSATDGTANQSDVTVTGSTWSNNVTQSCPSGGVNTSSYGVQNKLKKP